MPPVIPEQIGRVVWLLGFFLLRNFYFVLMEMGPRAATFGKRAMGLRVVAFKPYITREYTP